MFGIGMPELVIILVILMIIFGANKLPQMGTGLAKGIRNFKNGIDEKEETSERLIREKVGDAIGSEKGD